MHDGLVQLAKDARMLVVTLESGVTITVDHSAECVAVLFRQPFKPHR